MIDVCDCSTHDISDPAGGHTVPVIAVRHRTATTPCDRYPTGLGQPCHPGMDNRVKRRNAPARIALSEPRPLGTIGLAPRPSVSAWRW
jgi:hypothetical protein